VVEFYLKLKPILSIITYLTYICWEIDNFVIKSDIFRRFVRIFLKNYRVIMTTALDTSCSENTMVLSARRGFLHACIFSYMIYMHTFLQLLDQNFIYSEIISAKTTAIHSALNDIRRLNMRNVNK
jgi:hypothetical protein